MDSNPKHAPMVIMSFIVTVVPTAVCIILYLYFKIYGLSNISSEIVNILIIMGVISFVSIGICVLAHCTESKAAKSFAYVIFCMLAVFFFALALLLWIHRPEVLSNLEEDWIQFQSISISKMKDINADFKCCGWNQINNTGPNNTECAAGSSYCKLEIRKEYGFATDLVAYFFVGFASLYTLGIVIGMVKLPENVPASTQNNNDNTNKESLNKALTA